MKSQPDSYTKVEIDQLVEEIYRTLESAEERLDRRGDDIYFPMDLAMSSLTSQIEAIQREIVKFQRYIARRPYTTLMRHQFNLQSLGDILQKIENTTASMKDKWRRGDEAMRDFTECLKEPKLTSNLIELNSACLGAWYKWNQILQTSLKGENLVEREDMNYCLPAGPDTCLSFLASCDRYPHGKAYTFMQELRLVEEIVRHDLLSC
ncbi:hypothetical protein F2Q70_00026042 [Brassica cretica]|uniref:Uncharacterized protein n=1 Tax=Brassica cretica TaxID=69181 RepID=A0A8S9IEC6_BRACR|nr:hypothetical protein F2Q68_00025568 [Brassica cretica]KAF2601640.1 hypothetical protein F2Q70_00026042 [Brassica cretica]